MERLFLPNFSVLLSYRVDLCWFPVLWLCGPSDSVSCSWTDGWTRCSGLGLGSGVVCIVLLAQTC